VTTPVRRHLRNRCPERLDVEVLDRGGARQHIIDLRQASLAGTDAVVNLFHVTARGLVDQPGDLRAQGLGFSLQGLGIGLRGALPF